MSQPAVRSLIRTNAGERVEERALLERVCVRPPYFALTRVSVEGAELHASAYASSPAFGERGPMPAAEIGRHAAIAGLALAAATQGDGERRFYLARRASCRYAPVAAPYGTEVRFEAALTSLEKRSCSASVLATCEGHELATIELEYTILTSSAFRRLFAARSDHTVMTGDPYGSLLAVPYTWTPAGAEQVVESVDPRSCAGHFDGHPALPVAVVMGQLSYLAGRLHGGRGHAVVRGEVSASDLVWAGERATFRAAMSSREADGTVRYRCEALAGERVVAEMDLWLSAEDPGAN